MTRTNKRLSPRVIHFWCWFEWNWNQHSATHCCAWTGHSRFNPTRGTIFRLYSLCMNGRTLEAFSGATKLNDTLNRHEKYSKFAEKKKNKMFRWFNTQFLFEIIFILCLNFVHYFVPPCATVGIALILTAVAGQQQRGLEKHHRDGGVSSLHQPHRLNLQVHIWTTATTPQTNLGPGVPCGLKLIKHWVIKLLGIKFNFATILTADGGIKSAV